MAANTYGSILSADFGSVHTRVVLIDIVDGLYRLVARGETRTTDGFPVNDLAVGLDRVLRELTDATGRKFMSDAGQIITPEQPDRSGVDHFTLTASLGRPLRAVLVGLVPGVSIASALRATTGTYISIPATLSLDDGRDEESRLNAILLSYPDLIFIVGGTEAGATGAPMRLARVVQLAISLIDKSRRPTVIFAGNSDLAAEMGKLFDNLTTLLIAQNVRPTLDEERLESAQLQLAQAFNRYKETRSDSFAAIGAMSNMGVLPTAQGYNLIVEYLGKISGGGVVAVDVGSSASTIAASFYSEAVTSIRTDIGLGHSAQSLLENIGYDAVKRWLPLEATDSDLLNYAANKALRPSTTPHTVRDLYIEHALLKAGIQKMVADARPTWNTGFGLIEMRRIISAGAALTNTGHPAYNALLLLDALQPIGISTLYADNYGLIPALGAVSMTNPDAVVQVLDGDSLDTLGVAFSPVGKPRQDRPAMRVRITLEDRQVIKHTVLGGHLWVYHLPPGQTAKVRVGLRGGLTINGKRSVKMTLQGGNAGLIFDARGRPLLLANTVEGRANQLPLWVSEVTGNSQLTIDDRQFEAMQIDQPVEEDKKGGRRRAKAEKPPKPPKERRGRRGRKAQEAEEESPLDRLMEESPEKTEDDLGDLRSVLS